MIWLIAGGGVVVGLALIVWLARRLGRAGAAREIAERRVEVKDAELDAAVNAPRDVADVVDRLRRGRF